jgi:hypothetical protein
MWRRRRTRLSRLCACLHSASVLFVCLFGVQFRESLSSKSWKEDLCNNQTKSIFFFFFFFFFRLFLLHTLSVFVLQLLFLVAAIQGGAASSWSMHAMHSRDRSWKATCRFLCNFVGDMWWSFWLCSWLLNPDLRPPDSHCALSLFLLSIRSWERCPVQQRSHALLGCEAHNCQGGPVERSHALLCVKLILPRNSSRKRKGKVWVSVCSFFPSKLKRETSLILAVWAKEVTWRIFDAIGRKQQQQQEQSSLLVLNCYTQFTIRLAEHQDARGGQNPSCLTPHTLCTGLIRSTIQRGNL